jgi:hypothetical protein
LLNGQVFDAGFARAVEQANLAAQNFGNHANLLTALGEAAKVDEPGGDDLTGVDRGDSANWHKNTAPATDFNQQSGDLWSARFTVCDKNVDDFSNAVSRWVKDATASQSGDEYSCCAHPSTLDE